MVIWKDVLPSGIDVKGTGVEETRPIVRNGVKILDFCRRLLGSSALLSFCLLTTGPSRLLATKEEAIPQSARPKEGIEME